MKAFFSRRSSPSFALVSVLALVSLAALSATAFLAAARLERLASRPLADLTRLEMASGTGLAMAMGVLAQAGSTNYGLQRIVTYWRTNEADDLGYLLLGIFTNATNPLEISYLPAFSSSLMITNALDPASTQTNASRVSGQGNYRSSAFAASWTNGLNPTNSTNFPLLGNQTSPAVAWIPIRQERRIRPGSAATTNVPVARMAFFVQDLQGLIDAERMGGSNNRTTGTNPAEISLTNLSGTALMSATTASNFVATNTRRLFASVGALTLSNAGGLATNDLRYVATGLRSWGWSAADPTNSFSNRIPPGIQITATSGYSTNAGQAKFDLNANLTAASLPNLVTILTNHLPNFTNRAGGFPAGTYLSSLAANLIDYVDTDSQPTYTNMAGTEVRGIEALPFVNERVTFFNLIRTNSAVVGGQNGILLTLLTQDFYEFWNPSSKATPAVSLSIVASNSLRFTLGFSTFNFNNPTSATNSAGQPVLAGATTNTFALPTIPANGFLVTNSLMVTNNFFYPNTSPPSFPGRYQGNTNFFRYFVYLGSISSNNLYDRTLVGCYFAQNANLQPNLSDSPANRRFFGSSSGFSAQTPLGTFRTSVGDPRIMFYLNDNQDQVTYATGSSFGGRNVRGNISAANNYREVIISSWPDGGHNSPAGAAAGTLFPTAVPPATYSNVPPGKISDFGSFTNLAELGLIYDPIQWRDPTFRTASGFGSEPNGGQWSLLTGAATADNRFGGGNTLRVGRAEHPRFAFTNFGGAGAVAVPNMGMSAVALLDLFRIGSADGNSFTGGGKINLNTAPRPVLAALAGGVALTNDPARTPATAPANATMTNAFAQGVLRFRQLYPFYSPSQLPFISTDYGVGTTWTNTWATTAVFATNAGAGLAGVTALNDAGREEWFSKIYGLSGVDSLNFRCYVIAQLTDANGNPRGAAHRKYYQIYTAPNPAALTNAALPPFRPVVVEEGSY